MLEPLAPVRFPAFAGLSLWDTADRIASNRRSFLRDAEAPEWWAKRSHLEPERWRVLPHAADVLSMAESIGDKYAGELETDAPARIVARLGQRVACDVAELLTVARHLWGADVEAVRLLDLCVILADRWRLEMPRALSVAGALARMVSPVWWRRALRRHIGRLVEHRAIVQGLVSVRAVPYASDATVKRRREQHAQTAAFLAAARVCNESGQSFTLAQVAATSVANPVIRRGELMTRIRGCESYADAEGHRGVFLTLTTPSRFHRMRSDGRGGCCPNPNYDPDNTPREAQLWLRKMWARVRAEWARNGVRAYGFRVAEPHHDGTPHWHALIWFPDGIRSRADLAGKASALRSVFRHWLSDDGDEPGAAQYRVKVKRLHKGGAAGYIAKYIAKNIQGATVPGEHQDQDEGRTIVTADDMESGAARVDAWAARWGIRQFQAIGQPPVTVWRTLRRVDAGQFEAARVAGDKQAWSLAGGLHKAGILAADWCLYMRRMGGACVARAKQAARLMVQKVKAVNQWGEAVARPVVWGVETRGGSALVSRVMQWSKSEGVSEAAKGPASRPWTRFNNCTARITGRLRAALAGGRSMGDPGGLPGRDLEAVPCG